jgi:Fe-Mn family superoxide dismutase
MERYRLPDLRYGYDALEPVITRARLAQHHDEIHRQHVRAANRALDALAAAREAGDFAAIATLERALAFHLSGHTLHSILWMNLSPRGGGEPTGALAQAIARDFGSVARLRAELDHAAATVLGAGWATLVWDPLGHRLLVAQLHDHQGETIQAMTPLYVIDVWEHAYLAQHGLDRRRYLDGLWHLVSWPDVEARWHAVKNVDLGTDLVVDGLRSRPGAAR